MVDGGYGLLRICAYGRKHTCTHYNTCTPMHTHAHTWNIHIYIYSTSVSLCVYVFITSGLVGPKEVLVVVSCGWVSSRKAGRTVSVLLRGVVRANRVDFLYACWAIVGACRCVHDLTRNQPPNHAHNLHLCIFSAYVSTSPYIYIDAYVHAYTHTSTLRIVHFIVLMLVLVKTCFV